MLSEAACLDIQLRTRRDCPPIGAYLRYQPELWLGEDLSSAAEIHGRPHDRLVGEIAPGGTLPSSTRGPVSGRAMQSGVAGANDIVGRLPPRHPDPAFRD